MGAPAVRITHVLFDMDGLLLGQFYALSPPSILFLVYGSLHFSHRILRNFTSFMISFIRFRSCLSSPPDSLCESVPPFCASSLNGVSLASIDAFQKICLQRVRTCSFKVSTRFSYSLPASGMDSLLFHLLLYLERCEERFPQQ
jgi:hypothetical protein